ncbi:MAG: HIT family protein [Corynebacterium sp.]|nr:HIT family protein [Corynebacterium sp.]
MSTIFTKIIEGEIPGRFVYEDEQVVAFLDINPLTEGHTLVVPRKEVDKWTDLSPEEWAHLSAVAQKIGNAQKEAFGAPRAGLVIAGFDVPHAHIHVFPAHAMTDFNFANAGQDGRAEAERLDDAQAKLRAAIQSAS